VLLAATIALAFVIGGLTQVSRQSRAYDANSDRSLAAQGSVLADQSNATSSQVRALMNGLPGQTRQGLQAGLDSAVQQTSSQAARADLAASNTPLGPLSTRFADVFAERSQSVTELRAAVYGFLGMQPGTVAGSPTDGPARTPPTALLSATEATDRIAAAGALLAHSDALYRSVRRSLATAAGHGELPPSAWVTNSQRWQVGAVAAQLDLVATSPTLAPTHNVVLRTVRLDPPALPAPQGAPSSVSILSPTSQIAVTVVVANEGTLDEPHASVRLTLANQSSGVTATRVERAALVFGATAAMPQVLFAVKPGTTYVLTVQVLLPPGQTQTGNTVSQQPLLVAPAT
jgi:hypothetical protein